MNWFKRIFGLDFIDFAIQFAVTGMMMGMADSMIHGQSDPALFGIASTSIVLFAFRRSLALKKAASEPAGLTTGQMASARLEELEDRVAQLESAEARVAELEERLDFAERLLAQGTGERAALPGEKGR